MDFIRQSVPSCCLLWCLSQHKACSYVTLSDWLVFASEPSHSSIISCYERWLSKASPRYVEKWNYSIPTAPKICGSYPSHIFDHSLCSAPTPSFTLCSHHSHSALCSPVAHTVFYLWPVPCTLCGSTAMHLFWQPCTVLFACHALPWLGNSTSSNDMLALPVWPWLKSLPLGGGTLLDAREDGAVTSTSAVTSTVCGCCGFVWPCNSLWYGRTITLRTMEKWDLWPRCSICFFGLCLSASHSQAFLFSLAILTMLQ